jgi:hypothetical protein
MRAVTITIVLTACLAAGPLYAGEENTPMSQRATGSFEVTIDPIHQETPEGRPVFPRMALTKTFAGDLAGTSQGEMMTAMSTVEGSGAYVAVEQVSGTLGGRTGTFMLVHRGTMEKGGSFVLDVRVVPDSGTGDLVGISGTMEILIDDSHHYIFDYALPPTS